MAENTTTKRGVTVELERGYIIERYDHENPKGTQWLVWEVRHGDSEQRLLTTQRTRREAAEYLAHLAGAA